MIYRCRKCTFVTQYRTSMDQHLLVRHQAYAQMGSSEHYTTDPITDALDSFDPAPYVESSSHCGQDSGGDFGGAGASGDY